MLFLFFTIFDFKSLILLSPPFYSIYLLPSLFDFHFKFCFPFLQPFVVIPHIYSCSYYFLSFYPLTIIFLFVVISYFFLSYTILILLPPSLIFAHLSLILLFFGGWYLHVWVLFSMLFCCIQLAPARQCTRHGES